MAAALQIFGSSAQTTTDFIPMDRREASTTLNWLKTTNEDWTEKIVEMHERLGWKALGYSSWTQFVNVELPESTQRIYQIIRANEERAKLISTMVDIPAEPIPERQTRELGRLDSFEGADQLKAEIYQQVAAEGPVTAAKLAKAVEAKLDSLEAPKAKVVVNRKAGRPRGLAITPYEARRRKIVGWFTQVDRLREQAIEEFGLLTEKLDNRAEAAAKRDQFSVAMSRAEDGLRQALRLVESVKQD